MLMPLRLCTRWLIQDEGLSKSPAEATPCSLGQGALSHKPLLANESNQIIGPSADVHLNCVKYTVRRSSSRHSLPPGFTGTFVFNFSGFEASFELMVVIMMCFRDRCFHFPAQTCSDSCAAKSLWRSLSLCSSAQPHPLSNVNGLLSA